MPAKRLAILNFKGGVGKTTNAVNIAAALAFHPELGSQRVLVVDLDPQCNATFWLLTRQGWNHLNEEGCTIRAFFRPQVVTRDLSIRDYIVPVPGMTVQGRLDMLAGDFSLLAVDDEGIEGMRPRQQDEVLWHALKPILNDYDYIIFDCPPGYSLPTRNAFRAAQYMVVPYTPDYLALEGVKWIRRLQARFAERHGWENTASLLGVIVNRFTNFNAQQQAISELKSVMDDVQSVLDKQTYQGQLHLFEPFIKEGTLMNEANNNQQLLVDAHPGNRMTASMVELTQNIVAAVASGTLQ